ncbi:ribosome-recycling factor, mitochondrial isoform X1 [Scyliorhinus canicula]|uniref:ribosome-recycling factor, mitochondrial isoform X1 n=2 Tax=Scyliorhinus canicula TaxID=7830 RepID=UPI0018F366F9|nr:ribosome-recycling factor, mitochondrial isoform X1 [Scyliorhinus canicula]XP_038637486.1 ribosome-recycling factor, mitochondrial isoform X1 [Scyliorhinus canicula]XP_038637487.1 ribosome-recycling factor, mitochondrial isoform X1 [Scyliorhinus canicula]XP_038637488.1 ribosome-recycling factor, mitochondrial isoform X1 [Scyliorhinus canicula]
MSIVLRQMYQLRATVYKFRPLLMRSAVESRVGPAAVFLDNCKQCGALHVSLSRPLATKKTKVKSKGQPGPRVNINAALVEDIINLNELKQEMLEIIESLKNDYGKNLNIRTSPGALDHITVTTNNGKFPLNHLGQISLKSPQLILVNMMSFPEATMAATKAIRESGMNLNPEVDGTLIRVPIPKVTREHRENLAKLAKQFTNKSKESLRKMRTNAIAQVKKSKDSVSEDTIRLLEKQIQQMADDVVADMEKHLMAKTKELLG